MSNWRKLPFALPALALWAMGQGTAAAAVPAPAGGGGSEPAEALQRAEAAYEAGRAYLQAGNALRAMEKFRAALRDNPASIDALNGLAVALDRVGRFDLSRPQYETALALDPNAPETLHNFGLSMYLQGNRERALPMLQKAASLATGPVRASSLALLGRLEGGARSVQPVMQAAAPPQEALKPASSHSSEPVQQAMAPPSHVQEDAPPLAPTVPSSVELVRIGAGEWRLADASVDGGDAVALAQVPIWTEADELAVLRQEAARLAALEANAEAEVEAVISAELAGAEPAKPPQAMAEAVRRPSQVEAPTVRRPEYGLHQDEVVRPLAHFLPRQPRRREDVLPIVVVSGLRDTGPADRRFEAPFQSDDPRLNAFAERMQGRGVDAIGRPRTPATHDALEVLPGFVALLPIRRPTETRAGHGQSAQPEALAGHVSG
jgi:Flp pilus assembly protein TadD